MFCITFATGAHHKHPSLWLQLQNHLSHSIPEENQKELKVGKINEVHIGILLVTTLRTARGRGPLNGATGAGDPWRHLAPKKCAHGQSQAKCERSLQ